MNITQIDIPAPINQEEYKIRGKSNIELYEGRAYNVFNPNKLDFREPDRLAETYLQKNIFKLITNTFVNLSVFEPVEVNFENSQEAFDVWSENNSFQNFIKKAFKKGSLWGDCIAVLYGSDEDLKIKIVDNSIWYPEYDKNNIEDEANKNTLKYSFDIDKKIYTVDYIYEYFPAENKTLLKLEVKENNQTVEEIPELILNKFGLEKDSKLESVVEGKRFFRFVNEPSEKDYFGLSDYTQNIRSIGENINDLRELQYYVQLITGNPDRAIPESVVNSVINLTNEEVKGVLPENSDAISSIANQYLNANNQNQQKVLKFLMQKKLNERLKNLPVSKEDGRPEYIQPNSTIQQLEDHIKSLKQELYEDLALPSALISQDFAIGNITGVALQKTMMRTLHSKGEREIRMRTFLRDILGQIFGEYPTIKFNDGIINDRKEKILELKELLALDLITKADSIKELYQMTETQALEYMQEIEKEKEPTVEIPEPEINQEPNNQENV